MSRPGAETHRLQRPRGVWFALAVMMAVVATTSWIATGAPPSKSAKPSARSAAKSTPQKSSSKSTPTGSQAQGGGDACIVLPGHELIITDLSVVESERATGTGPWTFAWLISQVPPANQSPSDFLKNFFETWTDATSASTTDFFNIDGAAEPSRAAADARTAAINGFFRNWPRLSNGDLDLVRAPLRLLGITNRLDILGGDADEVQGRFVFNMLSPDGHPVHGFLIMEYSLPQVGPNNEPQPVEWWANEWHKLSSMQLGSTEFLEQLEFVTRRFSERGVMPERPNGSALIQFRISEQLTDGIGTTKQVQVQPVWEYRAFGLDPESGQLKVNMLNRTPHFDYNTYHADDAPNGRDIETLIAFLTENKEALLDASYNSWFQQNEIELATSAPAGGFSQWLVDEPTPEGFTDEEWEDMTTTFFGGRTCNGCHTAVGTKNLVPGVSWFYISALSPREAGQESRISLQTVGHIYITRIPNVKSLVCPDSPGARRAPRTNADH